MVMKHTSENQKNLSPQEYEELHIIARKKRYQDMIMVLEHNGFKVSVVQKAMDQENVQMIAILRARGFTVIAPNENELEGVANVPEEQKKDQVEAPEEKGSEEGPEKHSQESGPT